MYLDPRISARLEAQQGVSSVTELVELGVSRHVVDRAVRNGLVVRLRRNVVVDAEVWRAAAPSARHELRARGTARAWRGVPFALSHHSALALHDIPVYAVDHRVHLVRRGDWGARSGTTTRIHPPVPDEQVGSVDGIPVVSAGLAALQVAAVFGVEAGLVSADTVLRRHPGTDFRALLCNARLGNQEGRAAVVAEEADGLSESPGESRCRWLLRTADLPPAQPQVWIRDGMGRSARVDFLLPERVIVEFDGLMKYQQADDLAEEKLREDWLRSLGYEVVRLTWADLSDPRRVRRLILEACQRSRRRAA